MITNYIGFQLSNYNYHATNYHYNITDYEQPRINGFLSLHPPPSLSPLLPLLHRAAVVWWATILSGSRDMETVCGQYTPWDWGSYALLSQIAVHSLHCREVCGEDVLRSWKCIRSGGSFPECTQWVIAYLEVGTHDSVIVGTLDVYLIVAW